MTAVLSALADDLNAPKALQIVEEWAATPGTDAQAPAQVRELVDAALGLLL
jgi:L-cysteine:1D-myo-inositol 2-amino-2-deoxy-alpha-D-glucopyranoside ligase